MAPTAEQIAKTATWLPTAEQDPNYWDAAKIQDRWAKGIAGTVRAYWYEKVSGSAGYIDLSDSGGSLPITQIYRQAREMLMYWDAFIEKHGAKADPDAVGSNGVTIGKIKRRYPRGGSPSLANYPYRSPYSRT